MASQKEDQCIDDTTTGDVDNTTRERRPSRAVLDEDAQRERLLQLKRSRAGHASNVTRRHSELKCSTDQDEAEDKLGRLREAFAAFDEAHYQYMDLAQRLEPEESTNHQEHRDSLVKLMQEAELDTRLTYPKTKQEDAASQVRSRHTSRSGCSSTSSAMAKAAAKKAALLAKAQFLQQQQEIELQMERERQRRLDEELKMKQQLDRIKLQAEITAATAEEETLAKVVAGADHSQSALQDTRPTFELPHDKGQRLRPNAEEFFPQKTGAAGAAQGPRTQPSLGQTNNPIMDLAEAFKDMTMVSRLPVPEPTVFSGDPLRYTDWRASFQALIHQKGIPTEERMHYLKRYVSGAAKEAIEGYFLLSSPEAYEEARALLDKRFGTPFVITNAFKKKLEGWPKIAPKDYPALRRFADFLHQCEMALITYGGLSVLDNEVENAKILTKLPEWLVLKWARTTVDHKDQWGTYPPFREFRSFLTRESDILCDPVISQTLADQRTDKSRVPKKEQNPKTTTRSFATDTRATQDPDTESRKRSCVLCQKAHYIGDCSLFLKKTLEERKDIIRQKGLCYGCLRRGHITKNCKNRAVCKTCSRRHPTALHVDLVKVNEVEEKTAAPSALSHASRVPHSPHKSSMIVPVWLAHEDDTQKEVLVYALLDTQSDTTFALESTLQSLGVSGTETTLLLSTMTSKDVPIKSNKIRGLRVRGYSETTTICLPATYTRDIMPANRQHIPTPEMARKWKHLTGIAGALMPPDDDVKIGLLIGYNCPKALAPREVLAPDDQGPFAQRTDLGWGIVGIIDPNEVDLDMQDNIGCSHRILTCEGPTAQMQFVHRTTVKEVINPAEVAQMFELDFHEQRDSYGSMSLDDKAFIEILQEGIHKRKDGHLEMPLPLNKHCPPLQNNREMAYRRLQQLERRLRRDEDYRRDYARFMDGILQNGYAEKVPESSEPVEEGRLWYLPHHGVYHPKKQKIRVVFDGSAKHQGRSLNDNLLKGPDMSNALIGILCRFRLELIAVTCDIEQMFFQFGVDSQHRDLLRFLWWNGGNIDEEPEEYRMTVHLFGAASSPGCANYGLRKCASDGEADHGTEAADFIRNDFYVDDGLKSVATAEEAINLVSNAKAICQKGGLRLHKFASNSSEVMESIPKEDHAQSIQNLDLANNSVCVERTLGVEWCIESDAFQFRITLKDQPLTRRGLLSTVSSVYDPLGFIAPVTLLGKQMLQDMCRDKADWDDPVEEPIRSRWEKWRKELPPLGDLNIHRCYKPKEFGKVQQQELHHFADASTTGYGQCSYLRQLDEEGRVHCSFVIGKARVAPLKQMTIPRLELTAALVSVRSATFLHHELPLQDVTETFWTDSSVALGYITNDSRRFHVFVANRVQEIRNHTAPSQWRHVPGEDNPADEASRGLHAHEMLQQSKWLAGPDFLWKQELPPNQGTPHTVQPEDPEVKKTVSMSAHTHLLPGIIERLDHISDWTRARKAIALCQKYIAILQNRVATKQFKNETLPKAQLQTLNAEDLRKAESHIVKIVQRDFFSDDIKALCSQKSTNHSPPPQRTNYLRKLDAFVDEEGVLRAGGRIRRGNMPYVQRHPAIVPKRSHVTTLLIKYAHERTEHSGRGMTMNLLRSLGYWIIGCVSAVKAYIYACVTCRKMRSKPQGQKMADLPEDRLEEAPPFTYCAVDFFGPWYIKEGRKELKRYGALFTCLCSRAIHIEVADSLSTDSFINALRRFTSLRGAVRQLRSDRGTNFVGAKGELTEALNEMDHSKIQQYLLSRECDYIAFKMNVPSASHMGGVWERQIRSVRNVLASLMDRAGTQLNDEALRTFMCEAAAIVNSRPLTTENLSDPLSPIPLTPNQLLTMKCEVVLPPPGKFPREDLYSRKYWRRVQHLANEFWSRWKTEYLQNLQLRQKWTASKRDIAIGDVVMIKDDLEPRGQWNLGKVVETYPSQDGHVRKVKIAVGDRKLDNKGRRMRDITYLERPIHKLRFRENFSKIVKF